MKLQSWFWIGTAAVVLPTSGLFLSHSMFHPSANAQSTPSTQESQKSGKWGKWGWSNKWQEQLNLTADQKAKIQAIQEQSKMSFAGLRQQMRAAWEKQQSLMAGTASDSELRQQHQEIQALRQQMSDRRFDMMLQIRAVLTPEQRTKLRQLHQEKRGRRMGGGALQAMMMDAPLF